MTDTRPQFAPWDEREWPRLLSSDEGARRVAAFHAIETRQQALLESWAAQVDEPLRTALARHARHAEWHASLWGNALADSNPSSGAADADLTALLDAIASPAGTDQLVEFLTGVYRVLIPRKITAYTYYQRAIGTQDSDADWRWIDLILKDQFDAIRDGELALQSILNDQSDVDRSAARRFELESLIMKTGGLVGPDSIGMASAGR